MSSQSHCLIDWVTNHLQIHKKEELKANKFSATYVHDM